MAGEAARVAVEHRGLRLRYNKSATASVAQNRQEFTRKTKATALNSCELTRRPL
jgi:hypothetical protein